MSSSSRFIRSDERQGGQERRPVDLMGKVARSGTLNLAGAAVSSAANLALALVVTRSASTPDAGIFFSATSVFLLITSLGQLGTSTGLVYFLSQARAHGTLHQARQYMRIAVLPIMALAVTMAVLLVIFAHPVAQLIEPDRGSRFESYVVTLALFIPAAALANVCYAATRGLGTMRASASLDQMLRPLLQVLLVAVALALPDQTHVAVGWGAPYVLVAVMAWLAWAKMNGRSSCGPGTETAPALASAFWRFSAPRALASVAQVAMQRLDIVLVAAMAGAAPAAVYAAASRFLSLGQMTGGAVSQAVQPLLGQALARKDLRATRHLYRTSTCWLVLLAWPLYLLLVVFAPTVLTIFGRNYAQGNTVLILLCLSMLVATGCGMVDMVLLMAGRTSWNLYNVLLAFGINLGLDLWLIPRHGILGAALGWAVAILTANLVPLLQVMASLRVHPLGRATVTAMALSLACFGAIPLTVKAIGGEGWLSLLASTGLGAICYTAALFRWRETLELAALRLARLRRT